MLDIAEILPTPRMYLHLYCLYIAIFQEPGISALLIISYHALHFKGKG